ncbi:MAG TPA: hypothetical protein VN769_10155 [Xanthobacteraceae bacterium]|nr:hypothetical protein [Xanthobacteraceae bacterium]
MIAVLRTMLIATLAAIVFAVAFTPRAVHRALDPDEPIAADGSMTAGRALTIYDTNPLFGAYGWPRQDPDDPANFAPRLGDERRMNERNRMLMKSLIGPLDWSRCEDTSRKLLINTAQTYYGMRGRQIHSFSMRGPRAKAAIEQEWSTPLDRQIDDFVRHAVQYGILHKAEVPANVYPEFAEVVADTKEMGAGCPPLKTDRGDQKL